MALIKLVYQSCNELILLIIDRQNEILQICNSKTNYEVQKIDYMNLFDKGKEKEQYESTKNMTDSEFIELINSEMKKQGYFKHKLDGAN